MMISPRKRIRAVLLLPFLLFVSDNALAQQKPSLDSTPRTIHLDVFLRSDRPSAESVADYVESLRDRTRGLAIHVHDVVRDRKQLKRLYEISEAAGRDKPVLPAFHCCDRTFFGFASADRSGPGIERLFTAQIYTRASCQRCQALKAYLPQLKRRWPAIRFELHEVDNDSQARRTWQALCRGSGSAPGLPTIDFARRVIIGYQGDELTGAKLEALIQAASGEATDESESRDHLGGHSGIPWVPPALLGLAMVSNQDTLDSDSFLALPDEANEEEVGEGVYSESADADVETDEIELPFFGRLKASQLGMPLFTLAVGLIDGFNPCAMWILVFLLSILVNIKDRRKILVIAGTFVLVSGLAYFAFMAAWLNLFLLVGIARPVQILLGTLALLIGIVNVKDFFAFKQGFSLSIPESQKPGIYRRVRKIVEAKYLTVAIGGAVALAIIVNMVELLCTAGLPALYTQILTLQEYPAWKNYACLALYILAYMFDDSLLVGAVVATLSHRRLQEREGRWLKLISGAVILLLGLVMLFRPQWLQLHG